MYSNSANVINGISKPTYKINLKPLTKLAVASATANAIIFENSSSNDQKKTDIIYDNRNSNEQNDTILSTEKQLNLWQFCRLYTIGQMPIMDFFVIYVILYSINTICTDYNYKLILIATIPLTIIFNIFTNKNIKISGLLILILLTSFYYLLTTNA